MINIRYGIFETNSSSEDSFSHSNNCFIFGTMDFMIKIKGNTNIEEFCNQFINWLNTAKYSKNGKLVNFKLINESENDEISTYLVSVSGYFNLSINVYVTTYYRSTYGQKEPDRYWVDDYYTKVTKNKDSLVEQLTEYLEKNYDNNTISIIELIKDNFDFNHNELEDHIWDKEDYDDYYDHFDQYGHYNNDDEYDYRHRYD